MEHKENKRVKQVLPLSRTLNEVVIKNQVIIFSVMHSLCGIFANRRPR